MPPTNAIRAGRAFVELFADDSKLVRGLKRARRRLRAFGQAVRGIGLKMMAAGAVMLAPLVGATKIFTSMGDQLDKMSKRTGFSAEALSELGFAAEQSGANLEAMEKAIRGMDRSITYAGQGLATYTRAFDQVGVNYRDLKNLAPEKQFDLIARALSKIRDPTERAGLAMQIFGRAGTAMLPLFSDGVKGMAALRKQARRLGLTISTKAAKQAAELTDRMNILWRVIKRAAFSVGEALAPLLLDLGKRLTDVGVRLGKWIQQNKKLIVTVLKVGVAVLAAGAAVTGLGIAFIGVAAVLGGIATAFSTIAALIGALLSPIGLVVAAVVGLGAVLLKVSGLGAKAVAWLGKQFDSLKKTALTAWRGISDALVAGDLSLAAKVLWQALKVQWLKGVNHLEKIWLGFKTNFLKYATDAFYGAVKIAAGAWAGLRAAWVQTVAFLKNTWTSFTSALKTAHTKAVGFVTRQLLKLRGLFDKSFDVPGALASANQGEQANLNRIQQDKKSRLAAGEQQRQQDLAAIGSEYENTVKALDQAAAKATQKQADAAQKQIDAATADLEKARKEYNAALAEAAKKRKQAAGDQSAADPNAWINKIKGLGDQLNQLAKRTVEVRGTFNAAAIQGLQASSLDQRIAEASETTAANTSRLVRDNRRQASPTFQ